MRFASLVISLAFVGCASAPKPSPVQAADALRRAGQIPEAYDAYAHALCKSPDDVEAARRFVELWNELGRPGAPQTRLEDCALDPIVAAFIDGLVFGARGDVDAAHAALKGVEADAPLAVRAEFAYRRGLLELGRERADLGQPHLERAAALAPERPEIRLALAQSLLMQDRASDCIATLRGVLSIETDRQQLKRARRILRTAVRRSEAPLDEETERRLGELLANLESGDLAPEALEYTQNLASHIEHPRVLTIAALVALRRGLELEATRLLERAAELNPLDPAPPRVLGASRYAAERPADAFVPLRMAFERDPFDIDVARMLAAAAHSVGETEVSRDTYRALARLVPDDPENHLWLARMERRLGRTGVARAAAEQGTRLAPNHIALVLELASIEAELALGAPTAAERDAARERTHSTLDRLQELAPGHPGAQAILASLAQSPLAP